MTPYIKKHTRENTWNISRKYIYIYGIPVNPLPGIETNDDWVVWLTVVLVKLISEN